MRIPGRRSYDIVLLLLRIILGDIYAIQEFFVKAMKEFTGIAFSTTTTKPKETRVPIHIVAKCAVTAIASFVKHVPTNRRRLNSGIYNVLGQIEVGIGHETRRRGCFFGQFLIHG